MRGEGGCNSRAWNHYGAQNHCGAPNNCGGAEISQQCRQYFFKYRTFASERHQVRIQRRQTCFLPRATWCVLQQIISLSYLVASHWRVSISDRIRYMKTWNSTLNSFPQLKFIASPGKYFLFLWNNVYEFWGSNYCIHKRWPMGPFQLSLLPLAQTTGYATAYWG